MKTIKKTLLEDERASLTRLKTIYKERIINIEERIKEIDNENILS